MCCKNGKKPGPQCPCALGLEGCHCKKLLLLKKTMKVSELFTAATPAWWAKRSSPHPADLNATHRHKLPTPQPSRATTTHKRTSPTSVAPRAGLRRGGWWGSRLRLRAEAPPLRTGPRPSPRRTHRWVPDAAGEGHSAALPAGVQVSAVEVDIEVPVVGPSGSAARPLGGGRGARVSQTRPRIPILFGDRPRLAGSGLETASQVGTSPPTGRAWAQGHRSSSRLLTRLMGAGGSGKGLLSLSP